MISFGDTADAARAVTDAGVLVQVVSLWHASGRAKRADTGGQHKDRVKRRRVGKPERKSICARTQSFPSVEWEMKWQEAVAEELRLQMLR
jgi:hypothetical protein